jgi:hypothetical protein
MKSYIASALVMTKELFQVIAYANFLLQSLHCFRMLKFYKALLL